MLSNLYKNTQFKMDGDVQYVIIKSQTNTSKYSLLYKALNQTKYKLHRQFYSVSSFYTSIHPCQ